MASETTDLRFADLPDVSVALALGVCVGRPQTVATAGQVSSLVNELKRRGVFDAMLGALDAELARSIRVLDAVDRGQRWAQTGRV